MSGPVTITPYHGGLLEQRSEPGRDPLFRYRCPRCGRRGRWLRDGNRAGDALEVHEGYGYERSRCRR